MPYGYKNWQTALYCHTSSDLTPELLIPYGYKIWQTAIAISPLG